MRIPGLDNTPPLLRGAIAEVQRLGERFARGLGRRIPGAVRTTQPKLLAHAHVALNITKRCNQDCIFCFEETRESWDEPSLEQVKGLLDEAARAHTLVIFMGAEALLRRDIVEIVRYAKGLGLAVSAFTNGQALARAGFVEELADAGLTGLEASFHYADADSFSEGAGVAPRFYERVLRGLANLGDHNRRHPEAAIPVTIETEMFRLNYRRLEDIRARLVELLGDSFTFLRLGCVTPTQRRLDRTLLEPLRGRRDELRTFIRRFPKDRELAFVKTPLCLIPDYEHLSIDVRYKLLDTNVLSNFRDKGQIGAMHRFAEYYATNPYRWVCQQCSLLPICPTTRTRWFYDGAVPDRDQKPIPFRSVNPLDVLARVPGIGQLPREQLASARAALEAIPIPESGLELVLRRLHGRSVRVLDVYDSPRTPILEADLVAEGHPVRLRLGALDPERVSTLQYVVKYLHVEVERGPDVSDELVERLVRAVAVQSFPPLCDWEHFLHLPAAPAKAARTLWNVFGARLWPGGEIGELRTRAVRLTSTALVLTLARGDGLTAELWLQAESFRDAADAPRDARLVFESPSVRAWLVPRGSDGADGGPADAGAAFERLVEAIREVATAAGELAPPADPVASPAASEAPSEAPSPALDGALLARPGSLRITLTDRRSLRAPLVFFVGAYRAGDVVFRRTGATAIAHLPTEQDRVFQAAAGLLLRVSGTMDGPPAESDRWDGALRRAFSESPLARRFILQVERL